MRLIDSMSKQALNELISKCWMTHDGMWFANTFFDQGIEKANQINKAAIRSLAPIEIKRFQKVLGVTHNQPVSYRSLQEFLMNVLDLLIPDFMNVEIAFPGDDIITWHFNERGCFAYNGISMLKAVDAYECGPLYRIRCWLDFLGVAYAMEPEIHTCIMNQNGICAGRFVIQSFANQE